MTRLHARSRTSVAAAALSLFVVSGCANVDSGDAAAAGEPAAAERSDSRMVPSGTSLVFSVDQPISTETHEKGDRFTATLRSNVSDVEGSPAIPEGVASRWVVSEATSEGEETLLAVELESVEVNGEWTPVVGTVTDATVMQDRADTDGETAAKIAVGAAAGGLIGQVLGSDTRSTLTGAGVGAAVGMAVALSTHGGSAVLPQGSSITVQLTEPLVIS